MLRPLIREVADQVLAVEASARDAEVRGSETTGAKLEPCLRLAAAALQRQRVPVRVQMRQKGRGGIDRNIVPELKLRRIGSIPQSLDPSAHAGGELGRVAVAHRLAAV